MAHNSMQMTLVMPVYNEAPAIASVIESFHEYSKANIPGLRFVVVEDGSTDGTKDILRELNKKIPFQLLEGEKRKGYRRSMIDGLTAARGETVLFCDSDGQHDPQDLLVLLKRADEGDFVSGYKCPRRDPFYRIIISRVYNRIIALLFGLKMKDINSGFALIKKGLIEDILPSLKTFRNCPMTELALRAHHAGYAVIEAPVRHYPRRSGGSVAFRPRGLPFAILGMLRDLILLKMEFLKGDRQGS